ncbi:putative citrate transporter-like domain-containing protein [Septoria linicola]|nr:putative citrate transporter-like domain-containing protein [Septoria linicola]
MADTDTANLDTSQIKDWRSIVTLIVFVVTNVIVLFPFHIPIYVPRATYDGFLRMLEIIRIIPKRGQTGNDFGQGARSRWVRLRFHMGMVTAPLIADLFLLAILAIGRQEVHDGTVGADNINPIDIMVFFLTLAYIAISIDASGLIRWLAFKVLQLGGENGHRLFVYLYSFFFLLTCFVGNDPIVLSGTAFLAYMTRVSSNIKHPRAWIHMQFAVANIGSAVLVSSNPTNLVLAGAFEIKFLHYSANVVVPVMATAIVLLPFLLYIVFPYESLIPSKIELHQLPEEAKHKPPVNPNIPNARGATEDDENEDSEQGQQLSLEEIMNPFLDKGGAWFGAMLMAATLITILALNASSQTGHEHPIFYITLPAAFIMFCWDLTFGWLNRHETRKLAHDGKEQIELARMQRAAPAAPVETSSSTEPNGEPITLTKSPDDVMDEKKMHQSEETSASSTPAVDATTSEKLAETFPDSIENQPGPASLQSVLIGTYHWCQVTFPTVTTVATHLPWKLVPFAFCMFVLVQALVTKGWVPVFAHGWDHWVNKTGTVGAIGGMGFLSVILCNFAGTNIGTTILLCRVVQAWVQIHKNNDTIITQRTFWATVYSMAIGVNYGAFSTAFSASLAGLLWRDILSRKHIRVRSLDFARINLPIIAATMVVGLSVLIGEVYIVRDNTPYVGSVAA